MAEFDTLQVITVRGAKLIVDLESEPGTSVEDEDGVQYLVASGMVRVEGLPHLAARFCAYRLTGPDCAFVLAPDSNGMSEVRDFGPVLALRGPVHPRVWGCTHFDNPNQEG